MSTIIDSIEKQQLRRVPRFSAGDRVRVHFRVVEGQRTRTQVFEGVVIKRQGGGARETFTVRKQSFGVGVERTFPVHSPKIEQLEVAGRGDVRRAKLYYLRDRVGKAARVAERRWGITDDVLDTEEGPTDVEGENQDVAEVEVVEVEPEGEGADAPADEEADAPAAEAGEDADASPAEAGEGAGDGDDAPAEEADGGAGEPAVEAAASDDAPAESEDGPGGEEPAGGRSEDEASERDG